MNKTLTFKDSGKSVSGGKSTRVFRGAACVGIINEVQGLFMAHTDKKNPGAFVACRTMEDAKAHF